jgi:hypothetical protein
LIEAITNITVASLHWQMGLVKRDCSFKR